jgi:hypothetical protein
MTRKATPRPAAAGRVDGSGVEVVVDDDVERLRAEVARLTAELDDERRVSAARLEEVVAVRRELAADFDRLGSALDRQRKDTEVRLARQRIAYREQLAAERKQLVGRYERRLGFRLERRLRGGLAPARPLLSPLRRVLRKARKVLRTVPGRGGRR